MRTKKTRFVVVGGLIAIVIVLMLALIGGATSAKAMTVYEATQDSAQGQRIQVTGNVVTDSFSVADGVLTFSIYDPDDPAYQLVVTYDKGVSATFGNEVTAICTGTVGEDGVLACSELVTKCPSKYESATDALDVSRLLEYGSDIYGKPLKVAGVVREGTLGSATDDVRFGLQDSEDAAVYVDIDFVGALSEDVKEGTRVVVTGSIDENQLLTATDVALEG